MGSSHRIADDVVLTSCATAGQPPTCRSKAFKSDRPAARGGIARTLSHPPVMRPSNTGSLPSRCAGDSVTSVNCCCTSAVARCALAVVEACDTCERRASERAAARGLRGGQAAGGWRHPPSPRLPWRPERPPCGGETHLFFRGACVLAGAFAAAFAREGLLERFHGRLASSGHLCVLQAHEVAKRWATKYNASWGARSGLSRCAARYGRCGGGAGSPPDALGGLSAGQQDTPRQTGPQDSGANRAAHRSQSQAPVLPLA